MSVDPCQGDVRFLRAFPLGLLLGSILTSLSFIEVEVSLEPVVFCIIIKFLFIIELVRVRPPVLIHLESLCL